MTSGFAAHACAVGCSSGLGAHALVVAVGWAIVQSLWQGAVVGALTAIALRVLARSTASRRYAVACVGLAALAAAWLATAAAHVSDRPVPATAASAGESSSAAASPARVFTQPPTLVTARGDAASTSSTSWRATLDEWSTFIVAAWLLGVCVLSMRVAFGWLEVQRVRKATAPVAAALRERAHAIAARLRISRPVQIAQSTSVHVPTVVGWLRPVILLPLSALSGLSPSQLDAIIAHELAHVRRHDYAINIVQTAIEVVLFYHPACWWISRQIRHERELCCDDVAVALCGDRIAYAEALTDLEVLRGKTPVLSVAATDGALLRRVRRLLGAPANTHRAVPSWIAIAAPLIVVSAAVIGAQSRVPTPARVIPGAEGVVQGYVSDEATHRPVRAARVELIGTSGGLDVMTGEDGRYEAAGLRPGQYRVVATAAGYVTAHYGQDYDTPEAGMPLIVNGGQITREINFALRAAAVVSGRILDDEGNGRAGVEVELLTNRTGAASAVAVGFAQSESDGSYRFREVLPGDYRVRAYSGGDAASDNNTRAPYGNTYFPGVRSLDEAQPIHVIAGQELPAVDFSLVRAVLYKVAGRLIDPSGRSVAGVDVRLHSIGPADTHHEYTATSDRSGRFVLSKVPSGRYMLMANDPAPPGQVPSMRWGVDTQALEVSGDIDALDILAQAPAHVEGRVVIDSHSGRNVSMAGMRVLVQRWIRGGGTMMSGFTWRVADAGQFSFDAPAAESTLEVSDVPAGWMVGRILIDGREIGQDPVRLAPGSVAHVDIVITDRVTHLSGKVANRDGVPVAGATVLVFPDGPLPSTIFASPGSRWIRQLRTGRDGGFSTESLAPGTYLAIAVERLPYFAQEDPELLRRFSGQATSVRIGEGEQRVVNLRVVPPPPPPPPPPPQASAAPLIRFPGAGVQRKAG